MSTVEIIKKVYASEAAKAGALAAITKGCIAVHSRAVALAPADTGRLRNSLMWRTKDEEDGFNSQPGEKADTSEQLESRPRELEGYVGTNLDYATYVEFGTRNQAAQPYLRFAGERASGQKTVAEIKAEQQEIFRKFEARAKTVRTVKRV